MHYYRKILTLALPVMAENLLQAFMGLVDTYLVAQLGLSVISGLALATHILSVFQGVFIALGAVVSAALARQLVQSPEKVRETLEASLGLTVLVSVIFALFSVLLGPSFLSLFGPTPAVIKSGSLYLAWIGGASFTLGLMTCLGAVLRVYGRPRIPMLISLVVNTLNIFLSAFGVFVLNWGVTGVALGTVLARVIGVCLLWCQLSERPSIFSWRLDKTLLLQIFPAAGERLMMRLGDLVVVGLITGLGTSVLGGYAIGEVLTQFNYLPVMSVSVAAVILIAEAHGQKDYEAMRQIVKNSYVLSFIFMFVIAGGLAAISPWLLPFYLKDSQAYQAANQVIWASFLGTAITTGSLMMTAFWQSIGEAKWPFFATTVGMWVLRIGFGWVMLVVFKVELMSVLLATNLDNAFRWCYLTYRYLKLLRRQSLVKD